MFLNFLIKQASDSESFLKFLKEVHEDGKEKITNPDPENRKKYPKIEVISARKYPPYEEKLQKEYQSWLTKQKGPVKKPAPQGPPKHWEKFVAQKFKGIPENVSDPSKVTKALIPFHIALKNADYMKKTMQEYHSWAEGGMKLPKIPESIPEAKKGTKAIANTTFFAHTVTGKEIKIKSGDVLEFVKKIGDYEVFKQGTKEIYVAENNLKHLGKHSEAVPKTISAPAPATHTHTHTHAKPPEPKPKEPEPKPKPKEPEPKPKPKWEEDSKITLDKDVAATDWSGDQTIVEKGDTVTYTGHNSFTGTPIFEDSNGWKIKIPESLVKHLFSGDLPKEPDGDQKQEKPKLEYGSKITLDKDVAATTTGGSYVPLQSGDIIKYKGPSADHKGKLKFKTSDKTYITVWEKDVKHLFKDYASPPEVKPAKPKFEPGAKISLDQMLYAHDSDGMEITIYAGKDLTYKGPSETPGMLKFDYPYYGSNKEIFIHESSVKDMFEGYKKPEPLKKPEPKPTKGLKKIEVGHRFTTDQKVPFLDSSGYQKDVIPKGKELTYLGPGSIPGQVKVSYPDGYSNAQGYVWARHIRTSLGGKPAKPHKGPYFTEFTKPTFKVDFLSSHVDWRKWGELFNHKDLSPEDIQTIRDYARDSKINFDIRNRTMDKKTWDEVRKLDKILESNIAKLPTAVKVKRTVGREHPLYKLLKSGAMKEGLVYKDQAFQSTTLNKDFKMKPHHISLNISCPEGAHGLYMGPRYGMSLSTYDTTEWEVLFPRGVEIRVLSFDDYNNTIECEMIPKQIKKKKTKK